ncbi:MAG: phage portal protein [Clostridiales bacterium]|nr:phage portal protein [Clostridiales bacterium]
MQIGRKVIYTDATNVTSENIIPILQKAVTEHAVNAQRINYLLEYDAGNQPLQRKEPKSYRSDIDCHYIDNVASEISTWWMAYGWSDPITFIQRGEKDSGKADEPQAISLLNEQYEAAGIDTKTSALSRFVEITGIGYTYVDINMEWEDGDSFFNLDVLDPRFAFVVRTSSKVDHRIILGVTYSVDETGSKYFTCFSKDRRWEIADAVKIVNGKVDEENWYQRDRSGEENPLHRIPIIEWQRSYDRMGCFERQISAMDNLNLMESDFMNDVEQNTMAIWHGNDIDFPKDESGNDIRPSTNEWIITRTTQDGKTPFVKPLAVEYEYSGILEKIKHDRETILANAFVPTRNDNSGGSTGIAMNSATGYTSAEFVASAQENIKDSCKMEELKVVLAAIRESPYVELDSELLTLRYSDVKPKITRERNFELTTKSNALATLLSHGIYGLHAIKEINMFSDPNQVWEDSKEIIEKYQASIFEKTNTSNQAVGGMEEQAPNADRVMQDESDQVMQSPILKG